MRADAIPSIANAVYQIDESAKATLTEKQENQSVLALARAESDNVQSEALLQTEDEVSFALVGRQRDRGRLFEQQHVRSRVLTQKLLLEMDSMDPVMLENMLDSADDWSNADNPLVVLLQNLQDSGKAALYLAAVLAYQHPDAKKRKKLEKALGKLVASSEESDLSVALFGALTFGDQMTPALRHGLRRLYHHAYTQELKLSQWLTELGEPKQRRQKLQAMLHILAYELSVSGVPIIGSHLASVIEDLRQLGRVISVDYFCKQTAQQLKISTLDGEVLLQVIVRLVEQIWIDNNILISILPEVESHRFYAVVEAIIQLIQLLAENCFTDIEQRNQLIEALIGLRDELVEQEEEIEIEEK